MKLNQIKEITLSLLDTFNISKSNDIKSKKRNCTFFVRHL